MAGRVSAHLPSAPSIGLFAQDSLEANADLPQIDLKTASDTQQGAEARVDGAPLQLADAVELGVSPLCQPLLGQPGLPAQLLDRFPEGGMVGRTRFGFAARWHALAQPSRQRGISLDVVTANSAGPKRRPVTALHQDSTDTYKVPLPMLVRIASNKAGGE